MATATSDPIITIRDLRFTYAGSDRPALRGVDLSIERGEYLAIMGLNGAGKTTLGLCLNGIVPHMLVGERSGQILVAGLDPAVVVVREMAKSVGIVFDNPEFQMSQMTAAEEVALGLESLGVPHDEMEGRVEAALRSVGLDGVAERSPMSLSGGEQQRLAIASVLAMRPSILFMDEPTSNLDPAGRRDIIELTRRLNQVEGMTVILAEHDVETVAEVADRVVVMDAGEIVVEGTPTEVLGQVDRLASIGLDSPPVTDLAHRLSGGTTGLPVTIDQTLTWLESTG
jgi:energy-coupling factor transporter ATP-binding protein EcfA2